MADPFAQLGISRRPANVLFGKPNLSAGALGGWSDAAVQGAADELAEQDEAQAEQDEAQAAEDERVAREDARAEAARVREGNAKLDQLKRMEPSSRQKFLDDEGPTMAASPHYGAVAQQFGPSRADKTLQNHVALSIKHPEDQKIFADAVAAGEGTLEGKRKADENAYNRAFEADLTAAGIHPNEARRIRTEEGNSEAIKNHHIYKNRAENERGKDPEANRLRELYKNASEMATHSAKLDPTGMGQADPELVKRMRMHGEALDAYLTNKAKPAVPVGAGTVLAPPAEAAAPEDKRTVFEKMNGVKTAPPAAEKTPAVPAEAGKIISGANDINTLEAVIGSNRHSFEEKELALKRLQEIRDSVPDESMMPHELSQRRKRVDDLVAGAREKIDAEKVAEEHVVPVWNEAKNLVEERVKRYAQENNYPVQGVWNAIALGKPLPVKTPPAGYEDQFGYDPTVGAFIGNPYTAILGRDQEKVNPKFHEALGALEAHEAASHPVKAFFRAIGGEWTPPNYGKVLADLAKIKTSNGATPPQAAAAPLPQVKSLEEAAKLPPGDKFVDPDGVTRTVPPKKP